LVGKPHLEDGKLGGRTLKILKLFLKEMYAEDTVNDRDK
jgi:hypothetical protein